MDGALPLTVFESERNNLHKIAFLHRDQGRTINPGRTSVADAPQDVTPVDRVVLGVETPTLGLLGRSP